MFTYQKPFIGFALSINLDYTFFRLIHDVCTEFDYRSLFDFEKEHVYEILSEMPDVDVNNPQVQYQTELALI